MKKTEEEKEVDVEAPMLSSWDEDPRAFGNPPIDRAQQIYLILVAVILCVMFFYGPFFPDLPYPEDNPDIESEVRMLNKPPVETFETEYGDIFDCVDIYKQPALDHPFLQNHTIQMAPNIFFNETDDKTESVGINCPNGTVPIRRVTKMDIISARSYKKSRFDHEELYYAGLFTLSAERYKATECRGKYYGGKATFSSWSPKVSKANQYSIYQVDATADNPEVNIVAAGWMVYPQLFNDSHPRMFAHWTADIFRGTGCLNIYCSGFVQIGKLPLGFPLTSISIYGDENHQYERPLHMFRDPVTRNWWLRAEDENVGYWPSEIVSSLAEGASVMNWMGYVHTPQGLLNSDGVEMGSGHCPGEGYAKAAYVRNIQFVLEEENPNALVDVPYNAAGVDATDYSSYSSFHVSERRYSDKWGSYFFYGGHRHRGWDWNLDRHTFNCY